MTDSVGLGNRVYKPRFRFALFAAFFGALFLSFYLWLPLIVVILPIALVYAYFWRQFTYYELTEDGVKVRTGILMPKQSLFLYNQIQEVHFAQDLFGQVFGYANVSVDTMSGSSSTGGKLDGIEPGLALELRLLLEEKMGKKNEVVVTQGAKSLGKTGKPVSSTTVLEGFVAYPINAFRVCVGLLLYLLPFGLIALFFVPFSSAPLLTLIGIFLLTLFLGGVLVVFTLISYATLSYRLDGDWLEIKQSFLGEQSIRFPLSKIQNVILVQNWAAKALGLVDLRLETGENALAQAVQSSNRRQNTLASAIPALFVGDALKLRNFFLSSLGASSSPGDLKNLRKDCPLESVKPLKKTIGLFFWLTVPWLLAVVYSIGFGQNDLLAILFSPLAFVFLAIALVCFYSYQLAYYKNYRYESSNGLLVIGKGVFGLTEVSLPYSRVQNVFVDRDLLDRFFGLADVHLSTIGFSSVIEAHIDGVSEATAEKLKNELLKKVKENQ